VRRAKLFKRKPQDVPDKAIKIVVVAVVDGQGRVLIVRRPDSESHRPGEWECPGGHREEGETIEEAGIRESMEEVALRVNIVPGRAYFTTREGDYGVLLKAVPVGKEIKLLLKEHDEHLWADPDELEMFKPAPPDFAEEVRKVMKASRRIDMANRESTGIRAPNVVPKLKTKKRRKAGETRKGIEIGGGCPTRIEYAEDHKPTVNAETPEEQSAAEQAMFYSLENPAWGAMWNLNNLGAPDLTCLSEQQAPVETPKMTGHDSWSRYKENHYNETLYQTILHSLMGKGLHEGCTCSDHGDGTALVVVEEVGSLPMVARAIKRAGLKVERKGQRRLLVATEPALAPFKRLILNQARSIYTAVYEAYKENKRESDALQAALSAVKKHGLKMSAQNPGFQEMMQAIKSHKPWVTLSRERHEKIRDALNSSGRYSKRRRADSEIQLQTTIEEEGGPVDVLQQELPEAEITSDELGNLNVKTGDPMKAVEAIQLQVDAGTLKLKTAEKQRKEFSPAEYGAILQEDVQETDKDVKDLLMDLTFSTNHLGQADAWQEVLAGMKEAFPWMEPKEIHRKWRRIRKRTAKKHREGRNSRVAQRRPKSKGGMNERVSRAGWGSITI